MSLFQISVTRTARQMQGARTLASPSRPVPGEMDLADVSDVAACRRLLGAAARGLVQPPGTSAVVPTA